MAIEQEGISIMPCLIWLGTRFFSLSDLVQKSRSTDWDPKGAGEAEIFQVHPEDLVLLNSL